MNKCHSCKYKNYDENRYYRYCYNVYNYENNLDIKEFIDKHYLTEEEFKNSKCDYYWDCYIEDLDKLRYRDLILIIENIILEHPIINNQFPEWKNIIRIDDSEMKKLLQDIIPTEYQDCLYKSAKFLFDQISYGFTYGFTYLRAYEYIDFNTKRKIYTFDEETSISFLIDFLYPYLEIHSLKQDTTEIKINKIKKEMKIKYSDKKSKYKVKVTETKSRIGHGTLRKKLLKEFGHCFLTKMSRHSLLEVSHTKPYSKSHNLAEALDPSNVLLLEIRYSKLFDQGAISFDDDGNILFTSKLSKEDYDIVYDNRFLKLNINLTDKHKYYLKWHREVLCKNKFINSFK